MALRQLWICLNTCSYYYVAGLNLVVCMQDIRKFTCPRPLGSISLAIDIFACICMCMWFHTCPRPFTRRIIFSGLVLKDCFTRLVWSFCSTGVSGAVLGQFRICSTLTDDGTCSLWIEQLLDTCSLSLDGWTCWKASNMLECVREEHEKGGQGAHWNLVILKGASGDSWLH